jgi:putative nucleotidyltransferase with HDIG domain
MEKDINPILLGELKKKIKELAALREISKAISVSLELNQVLATIMDSALELLNAKKGSIILLDSNTKKLNIAVARGLSEKEIKEIKIQTLENISQPRISRSFLSTPLKNKDTIIGVIHINDNKGKGFNQRHLEILQELADHAAIAIDNAASHQELQRVALNIIRALAVSIDQRDHYTRCHSENVARYAVAIAREMNLSDEEIEKIQQAAQLHDIGKIGIKDAILSKPGKLTPEEWKEIEKHTLKGAEILSPLEFLDGIVDIIKQHHERPNGKGYPAGLKNNDIRIGAKIMAVADSFDAMISERPYRPAMSRRDAVDEIKRGSAVTYDSAVVKAFLRVVEKNII